jgi:hypothetical protein
VREIIAADLCDVYAPQRQKLLSKLTDTNIVAVGRAQAKGALSQLRQEEARVFRQLFNIPEPKKAQEPMGETNVSMPLVFQAVSTNGLNLTADDLEAIERVRESFTLALGGANQDVNSPDYLRKWGRAQKEADSLLDALIGRQAFLKYESGVESPAVENGETR